MPSPHWYKNRLCEILLFDRRCPPLQVGVTDSTVEVDRRLGDALEAIQVERALVDNIGSSSANARVPRDEIRVGSHRDVESVTNSIAKRERREERQQQGGGPSHPPHSEA